MKLTKRFVAISTAATAVVLFSAGGAQAQDHGEFLSFLGTTTFQRVSYAVQVGDGNTYIGTQNINTNNNTGGGTNNNNNNNGGGVNNNNNNNNGGKGPNNNNNNNGGGAANNNNNNNNGLRGGGTHPHDDAQIPGDGEVLSLLGNAALTNLQTCYPVAPVGQSSTFVTEALKISCNQN
ncbi:hypothetical protein [Streptomyces sp. G-G2]|uniref:hypothetical protein n=1 Tax=Streptomyces sp. G-G2 TaxID=3046201 RepID=UPI0024BAA7DE|nr:hypothetical protein [Streptomyces sp. G-G2]MDJ0382944.1 hypothetical protein [Streptomyces sp. G-G2]